MKNLMVLFCLIVTSVIEANANNPNGDNFLETTVTGTCSNCICEEQADGSFNITVTCTGTTGVCITFSGGSMTTTCECDCGGGDYILPNTSYPYENKGIQQIGSSEWRVGVEGVTIE